MIFSQNLNLTDLPFLAVPATITDSRIYDTFETYVNGAALNGLNGGNNWAGTYADHNNVTGVYFKDTLEGYANGAALNGLNGDLWSGTYTDRTNFFGLVGYDNFESYGSGIIMGGLNAGTYWTGPWTMSMPNTTPSILTAGTLVGTTTITLTTPVSATPTFYYSTNGTAPTTASQLYAGPIAASGTFILGVLTTAYGFEPRTDYGTYPFHPNTVDWVARVQNNGGATPSFVSINAINGLAWALSHASIDNKMKAILPLVPDSVIAATTPFIKNFGNDPWTNTGFVLGDLSLSGMVGGSGKWLDSGINPNTVWADNTNGGMTVYVAVGGNVATCDLSAADASYVQVMELYADWSDNVTYCDLYGYSAGRISASNSAFQGFVSGNRYFSGSAYCAIYVANSTTPIKVLASTTSAGGVRPNFNVWAFCNNPGGVAGNISEWDTRRLSLAALHDGLTIGQATSFFNAIVAYRTALGGGYV